MKSSSSRYSGLAIVVVLIVVWAAVSWYGWSDAESGGMKGYPSIQRAASPILILSWPAHEVCLGVSGAGFGANARSATTAWTFAVFLIQAVLTWSLLLIAIIVRKRFVFYLCAQAAILLLLFATFWRFGNG